MVGVALEVVEQDVRGDAVAVPAVPRSAALVAAVLALLAQQAVGLEVVDDLEQAEADDGLKDEVREHDRAEGDREDGEQNDGHSPRVENVVSHRPRSAPAALQPLALELPARTQAAGDGA